MMLGFITSTQPTSRLLTSKTMNIFARIQPQKTFHITIESVAKLLGIPPEMILRIEKWPYVLFIHRRDIGGQFISYRKLKNWQNAIAMKIQTCNKHKKLLMLWVSVILDGKKYAKQYGKAYHDFVDNLFNQQWNNIFSGNYSLLEMRGSSQC